MSKPKRPTLQDIASHLGITKMTVSRFLRDPNTVAKETGERIAQAIELFGYIPNRAPDILSNAKSRAIGVLVPSLTNQVFADVIKGIEQITDQAGYQTMLAHYGYSEQKEEQRIESLLSYNIDGIILSENHHSPRTLKMLEVANIPVIEIMESGECGIQQAVGFDNISAAQAMVETMIHRGCRQVVYFGARMDKRSQLKMQGYEQAMLKHGLSPHSITTAEHSSFTLGASQLKQALEQIPQLDGIFCTNDDLAIGALFECQRLGINVPQQIKIAGFHGHDVGQSLTPQLASVMTPRLEMGRVAAQELLDRIHGVPQQSPIINLGYHIHLGESV
ncbi:TPA: gluconate operon transcriptional repressor GntR [Mannheimia haemolytica]|uniref:Gluconate utilization system GNT-I transcriptional repressor n=1 Tax=Mannheimia haemolytica TaxID=75985 RepID=A0A378NCR8_MANHA|nr:gluconate operon transcriptional repressor GntR [Mannheimia haemolytica]AGQ39050.1 transcriptional regulator [Mannheimia haemolytica D171]AJE09229.1 transcriptional regulator [Mannheimia haemolytica USDA-ARS-USMARC-184]EEY10029.1 PurR family transcriptional regulator [Mannheimia haemolytica serotype A2 str. OVINE]EEY12728.1 PurR family transcriptional regulator [Mannheimia haemolytica serotype A2 str. BOVINE]EPZ01469.1 transcriptional regulator [Mannheimia haemolytica D35]